MQALCPGIIFHILTFPHNIRIFIFEQKKMLNSSTIANFFRTKNEHTNENMYVQRSYSHGRIRRFIAHTVLIAQSIVYEMKYFIQKTKKEEKIIIK